MAHLPVVDEGAGVVDAVLVAEGVEPLLVGEHVHQADVDVGGRHVWRELPLVAGGQLDVGVPAADAQHRLVPVLPGEGGHLLHEHGVGLDVPAGAVVNDIALIARSRGKLAVGGGPDAVGLVKGPGHAVHVDVPAEEQGKEGCLHQFSAPRKEISYQARSPVVSGVRLAW